MISSSEENNHVDLILESKKNDNNTSAKYLSSTMRPISKRYFFIEVFSLNNKTYLFNY